MYKLKIKVLFILFIFFFLLFKKSFAIELSVEAPQETLMRGQVFEWKVNIDTQGESIQTKEFYFTYEKDSLEMESFMAGDFFDNVSYAELEPGKLYVKGELNSPKSGTGLVAMARMKIIAESPGSANLCAATLIQPTTPIQPTSTLSPTQPSVAPTSLLKSGQTQKLVNFSIYGTIFLVVALLIRFI